MFLDGNYYIPQHCLLMFSHIIHSYCFLTLLYLQLISALWGITYFQLPNKNYREAGVPIDEFCHLDLIRTGPLKPPISPKFLTKWYNRTWQPRCFIVISNPPKVPWPNNLTTLSTIACTAFTENAPPPEMCMMAFDVLLFLLLFYLRNWQISVRKGCPWGDGS